MQIEMIGNANLRQTFVDRADTLLHEAGFAVA
jgi:hypothetical protein